LYAGLEIPAITVKGLLRIGLKQQPDCCCL